MGVGTGHAGKSKAYTHPLPALADEQRYATKCKELKARIREVEGSNADLQLTLLQSTKRISRLRIERTVLYDALAALATQAATDSSLLQPLSPPSHNNNNNSNNNNNNNHHNPTTPATPATAANPVSNMNHHHHPSLPHSQSAMQGGAPEMPAQPLGHMGNGQWRGELHGDAQLPGRYYRHEEGDGMEE